MKGRDAVNWVVVHKDYTIPAAFFLLGIILGAVVF